MTELRSFKLRNGQTIDFVSKIGTLYKQFGAHILRDKNEVDIIEHGCHYQPKCIVDGILGDWLKGKGRRPVTWGTFAECLEKSNLSLLAEDIRGQFKID